MVSVIDDDLWVCGDCAQVIANGEWSWLDYHDWTEEEKQARCQEIEDGLEREAPAYWVMGNTTKEFAWSSCDCCFNSDGGPRYQASLLDS